ncbi:pyridoxamine 5'-phosphate oxidase family protein [Paenibacillus sp. FJAT-26967]|uniref:pyridoxamine 5'-phosphate oxidase family protein n=1 Tax=Paenibacillus sp. FJAT-26967 TaxID=1729690 RepID=UPI0008388BAC|nr:pyridoxamine 5'-phosphate oxidase family protein [Paenibacillus sp. FJAT-26967]
MSNQELGKKIEAVLDQNEVCSFATVDNGKPRVRYMALFHEGLTIYLATNRKTDKVDELKDNPNVHILVGFDGKPSKEILQIEAQATVSSNDSLREKVWRDDLKEWFDGPHDPNYVILEIKPIQIEYIQGYDDPQIWQA